MAETQRLGLEMFGGWAGGSIADRNYKFTTRDRQIIDAFLQALEGHRHTGGSPLADPTTYPALVLNPVGSSGVLPGGETLFYVVSYVDEWGLESGMSQEASVTTPSPFATPPAPAVTPRTGGALVAGTYYYQVTHTQAGTSGEVLETLSSPTTVVTLAGTNHTARVSLPPVPTGASGWRVYRLGQNDPYAFLVQEVTDTSATYWDDAGAVPGTSTDPLENTTNSQNAVEVDIPDAGLLTDPVAAGQLRRWRIYRSDTSGDYSDTSLVHEVVETVNETFPYGPLVSSWIDDGSPLQAGSPLLASTTFNPPETAAADAGAGSVSYAPLTGGIITATDIQDALDQVDVALRAAEPRVAVTFAAADAVTVKNWGIAGISGLAWTVPDEFSGWQIVGLSGALVSALTAGQVAFYVTHSVAGTGSFDACDQPVTIAFASGAPGKQYGHQGTPYLSAHAVAAGDVLSVLSTISAAAPGTDSGTLTVVLRKPA